MSKPVRKENSYAINEWITNLRSSISTPKSDKKKQKALETELKFENDDMDEMEMRPSTNSSTISEIEHTYPKMMIQHPMNEMNEMKRFNTVESNSRIDTINDDRPIEIELR